MFLLAFMCLRAVLQHAGYMSVLQHSLTPGCAPCLRQGAVLQHRDRFQHSNLRAPCITFSFSVSQQPERGCISLMNFESISDYDALHLCP
jgi:hypothetical protein